MYDSNCVLTSEPFQRVYCLCLEMDLVTDIVIEEACYMELKMEVNENCFDVLKCSGKADVKALFDVKEETRECSAGVHEGPKPSVESTSLCGSECGSLKKVGQSKPLQCPACDKLFKGGKVRYQCLLRHVVQRHQRKSRTLLRKIRSTFSEGKKC